MATSIIIDETTYTNNDVMITTLKRTADILDKSAHRSEDGVLHREVIGTYYNYQLNIVVVNNVNLYNQLFEKLSDPVPSHSVVLPNDNIRFDGYFSSISDEVNYIDDEGCHYTGLSCRLTAMRPRKTP